MNRIELKPNIILEGFDDKREFDMKLHYLTFNATSPYREGKIIPLLYEGKTSEIREELTKECVKWEHIVLSATAIKTGSGQTYKDYSGEKQWYIYSAKKSIQSACDKKYCIIYETN